MKTIMRKIISTIVYWLSYFIKPQNILVFHSFPDYSDNPFALYKYLMGQTKYSNYKMVWILSHPTEELITIIRAENPHVTISHSTARNWIYIILSRYILSSHNAYGYLHFRQPRKLFNLWHGMPLKKICLDNPFETFDGAGNPYLSTIATSEFFQNKLSSAFGISKDNILITGMPRADLLFEKSSFLEKVCNGKKYRSIGIWMPTFRQSNVDTFRSDAQMENGFFNYWDENTLNKINDSLVSTNDFLILKIHPADLLQTKKSIRLSNILILRNEDMPARETNRLLGSVDYLITDYSSAWVDFDVLNKPMGFVINDFTEYIKGRPMYINAEQFPGKLINSFPDFIDFVKNHKQYNTDTGNFFNQYKDNKNSERVACALSL